MKFACSCTILTTSCGWDAGDRAPALHPVPDDHRAPALVAQQLYKQFSRKGEPRRGRLPGYRSKPAMASLLHWLVRWCRQDDADAPGSGLLRPTAAR